MRTAARLGYGIAVRAVPMAHSPRAIHETFSLRCVLPSCRRCGAQQLRFDDVVRNLRNPDPKARLSARAAAARAKYPEAVAPIAPLVTDPIDEIQLEAIAAELSFFLDRGRAGTEAMVGFVVEGATRRMAAPAFELGPLAVWPRPCRPSSSTACSRRSTTRTRGCGSKRSTPLGVVARPPLAAERGCRLDQGARSLRPGDPRRGGARDRPARGHAGRRRADQGDQRFARRRCATRRCARSASPARDARASALTEQLAFYRRARARGRRSTRWRASRTPSSVAALQGAAGRQGSVHPPRGRRRARPRSATPSQSPALQTRRSRRSVGDGACRDGVRAAEARAQLRPRASSTLMDSDKVAPQAQDYLLELGPSVAPGLLPRLQEPESGVRAGVADVLGALGDPDSVAPLAAAHRGSRSQRRRGGHARRSNGSTARPRLA